MKKQLIYIAIATALMSNWAWAEKSFFDEEMFGSGKYEFDWNGRGEYDPVVVTGDPVDAVWKIKGEGREKTEVSVDHGMKAILGSDCEFMCDGPNPTLTKYDYDGDRVDTLLSVSDMTLKVDRGFSGGVVGKRAVKNDKGEVQLATQPGSLIKANNATIIVAKNVTLQGQHSSAGYGGDITDIIPADKLEVFIPEFESKFGTSNPCYIAGLDRCYDLTAVRPFLEASKTGNVIHLTNSTLINKGEITGTNNHGGSSAPHNNPGGDAVTGVDSTIINEGVLRGGSSDASSNSQNITFEGPYHDSGYRSGGAAISGEGLTIINKISDEINPETGLKDKGRILGADSVDHMANNPYYDIENQRTPSAIKVNNSYIENYSEINAAGDQSGTGMGNMSFVGGSGIEGDGNRIINYSTGEIRGNRAYSQFFPTNNDTFFDKNNPNSNKGHMGGTPGAAIVGGNLYIENSGILSTSDMSFNGYDDSGLDPDIDGWLFRRGDAVRFTSGTADKNQLVINTGSDIRGNIAVSQGNYAFRYHSRYFGEEPTEQTSVTLIQNDETRSKINGGLHLYDNSRVYTDGKYGLVFEGRIISSNKAHITIQNYIENDGKNQTPQYITAHSLYICGGEGNNMLYTACLQPYSYEKTENNPDQKPLLDTSLLVLDPIDPNDRDKLWDQQRKLLIVLTSPDKEKRIIGEFGSEFDFTSIEHDSSVAISAGVEKGVPSDRGEISYVLSWFHNKKPHGDFTLKEGESFTLIRDLNDQSLDGKTPKNGWDGQSLTKKGAGIMNLNSVSTYTGTTTIEEGTLKTLKENAFSQTSKVSIGKNGVLNLGGNSQQVGEMINEGTVLIDDMGKTPIVGLDVTMTGNVQNNGVIVINNYGNHYDPRNKLRITGNYIGGNGVLSLGVNQNLADMLYIGGIASGHTTVKISNENTGAMILQNLKVIETGKSEHEAFTQGDNRVIGGGLEYYLRRGGQIMPELDDNSWYLTTGGSSDKPTGPDNPTYRPEGGGYITIHNAGNTIFNLPVYDLQRNDRHLWGYVAGGYRTFTSTNSGQNETRSNRYVFEVGGDFINQTGQYREKDLLQVGLMAGYGYEKGKTHNAVSGYNSKSHLRGYNIGVYGIWQENAEDKVGWGVAGKLYWNHFRNSVNGDQLPEEKFNSRGFVASASVQYSFLANEWISALSENRNRVYIQPKLDITWMGVKAKDHTEHNKTRVSSLGNNNIQLVPGVRFRTDSFGKYSGSLYTEINWIYNTKRFGVQMNNDRIYQRGFRNAFNAKFGGQVQLNRDSKVWADLDYIQGESSYLDVKFTLGYQHNF